MDDPALALIRMQQRLLELSNQMRRTNAEDLDNILLSCEEIRVNLSLIQEWALDRKKRWN
jgi:hypothetical protein